LQSIRDRFCILPYYNLDEIAICIAFTPALRPTSRRAIIVALSRFSRLIGIEKIARKKAGIKVLRADIKCFLVLVFI